MGLTTWFMKQQIWTFRGCCTTLWVNCFSLRQCNLMVQNRNVQLAMLVSCFPCLMKWFILVNDLIAGWGCLTMIDWWFLTDDSDWLVISLLRTQGKLATVFRKTAPRFEPETNHFQTIYIYIYICRYDVLQRYGFPTSRPFQSWWYIADIFPRLLVASSPHVPTAVHGC